MKQTMQKGFTLIELMIVVAIIGILAAVALPAYQDYMTKAKFSEVVLGSTSVKAAVEICAQDQNDLAPCDGNTQGIPADFTTGAGKLLKLAVSNGIITATAVGTSAAPVNGLTGQTYILTPALSAGKVTWTVSGTCSSNPKIC